MSFSSSNLALVTLSMHCCYGGYKNGFGVWNYIKIPKIILEHGRLKLSLLRLCFAKKIGIEIKMK